MTLYSNTQTLEGNDNLEENPQRSSWITMKTPKDLRDGQLNDSIIRLVLGWKEEDSKLKWDEISHMCSTVKHNWPSGID